MSSITNEEAKEGLESIGMWMDARYTIRFVGRPIQTWDMPPKEKDFFTVYAMRLVLEGDGFDLLVDQKRQDVEAFVELLRRLNAPQTSDFVQRTIATLRIQAPPDEDESAGRYYELFESEQVWLKLLDRLGWRIYKNYVRRAEAIDAAGDNVFDPKQWQGDLPDKKWYEIWK